MTVPQADDVYWPARLFHLLAPEAEEPAAAAAEAVVMLPSSPAGLPMGIVSPVVVGGAKAAGGKGRAPPPSSTSSTWSERLVGFEGGPTVMCRLFGARNEEEALLSVPRAGLRPFPRVLREAPLDSSNAPLVRARLAALEWAARHPQHSHAPAATAPAALPPAKAMGALVGRGIEVLMLTQAEWSKGLVESYDETSGSHFVVYADGNVEWLSLHSGHYAWELLDDDANAELRAAIAIARRSRLRCSLPGRPLAQTPQGDRLYGPPAECQHCHAPSTAPGSLLSCCRCAGTYHPGCLYEPEMQAGAQVLAVEGRWVCDQCASCEACGAVSPSELRGHWPVKGPTGALQGPWRHESGRGKGQLLCVGCANAVKYGGRCASTLQR